MIDSPAAVVTGGAGGLGSAIGAPRLRRPWWD
jgi:NAD(P)-dependent dehydrogenase (short-subunit alcohol dehydrogenase family)